MHITILQNVNIWGLPLRFDIVNYLIPMWHVCSNKFQFYFWLPFGSCLCEFPWYGFSLICIPIYYLRNHLFHIILTMALPVGSNSWNYQQTLLKIRCFISYPLPYVLSHEDDLVYLYSPRKYFLILIVSWLILILALALNWLIYCLPCLLHGS